jgi:hypothetical protein
MPSVGPKTDAQAWQFYKRCGLSDPAGAGRKDRLTKAEAKSTSNSTCSAHRRVSGSATIWRAFTVGNFLYGRTTYALVLLGVFIVSGSVLIRVINRLWAKDTTSRAANPAP